MSGKDNNNCRLNFLESVFQSGYVNLQWVDMYTLGIILFEMCNPPFGTGMERVKTIAALRQQTIVIPDNMINDPTHNTTVELLRWLLNHDPALRPSAEELLASELVPAAQLEANEIHEMLRSILANPQSKIYKHLVGRCLQQECGRVLEMTYHLDHVTRSSVLEIVKNKVINLFRKHGAIEISTPLLTPYTRNSYVSRHPVKLMTRSGSVVVLPSDLHAPFARYVATSGMNTMRRYSVNRVYREKKAQNFHPKQIYECAFDIITPNPGDYLVDAELLSVGYEMVNELPLLKEKNISVRINHTNLLRAILLYCNVPSKFFEELFICVLDHIEGRVTKYNLQGIVGSIMKTSKPNVAILTDLLLAEFPLGGSRGHFESSALRVLIRGKGEAASLAKGALRQLETVVGLAQALGVSCPIYLVAGLPIGYRRGSSGGIVWQMIGNLKANALPQVFAIGERYDSMLAEFQQQALMCNLPGIQHRPVSGAGMSFSLDKLVSAVGNTFEEECRSIDIVVCVTGSRPPLKDVTHILRVLWSAGIRTGLVEASNPDDAQDYARDLGASHFILLADTGVLRVRSWDQGRFQERSISRTELVDYVQRVLRIDAQQLQLNESALVPLMSTSSGNNLNNIRSNYKSKSPSIQVVFITAEKSSSSQRRRTESQVIQHMSSTLQQFGPKESFNIIIVDLPTSVINGMIGAINPRESKAEMDKEMMYVLARFARYKHNISLVYNEIVDILSEKNSQPIVALYSTKSSYFRVTV